jgi:hypothetical protein
MPTIDPALIPPLRTLGYSPKWIEHGFLDRGDLESQMATFQAGEEQNTGHLRHAAFLKVLGRGTLPDATVDRYVELALEDVDQTMARAALTRLIEHPGLTPTAFARLKRNPRLSAFARLCTRVELMNLLRRGRPDRALLERCVAEGDGTVHRELLERDDLPRPILEALQGKGANPKVQKLAQKLLKSRK